MLSRGCFHRPTKPNQTVNHRPSPECYGKDEGGAGTPPGVSSGPRKSLVLAELAAGNSACAKPLRTAVSVGTTGLPDFPEGVSNAQPNQTNRQPPQSPECCCNNEGGARLTRKLRSDRDLLKISTPRQLPRERGATGSGQLGECIEETLWKTHRVSAVVGRTKEAPGCLHRLSGTRS